MFAEPVDPEEVCLYLILRKIRGKMVGFVQPYYNACFVSAT